ncbi:MAG: hypothetical protein Q4G28_01430 [Neisseria sp.]|nr:hypothetical protein [Neisseria sp.]
MGKTILFGMPPFAGIYRLIEKNLQYYGFSVIGITEIGSAWKPSAIDRIRIKWRKLVYKDYGYKKNLQWKQLQQEISKKLEGVDDLDYALFINSDIYSKEFLQFVSEKSRHGVINYQFDGLHRFPDIYPLIEVFNKFYVFTADDLKYKNHQFFPATNFYFDYDLDKHFEIKSDFYFTGAHMDCRINLVNRFSEYAHQRNAKLDMNVCGRGVSRRTSYHKNINLSDSFLSFEENLKRARESRVLIDFVIDEHRGLSFRTFEAIGYRKKLITTNPEVLSYDFYHPNNFLVWDGESFSQLDDFLTKPYYEIDPAIREKYSFGNWIKYILEIDSYLPIGLPLN